MSDHSSHIKKQQLNNTKKSSIKEINSIRYTMSDHSSDIKKQQLYNANENSIKEIDSIRYTMGDHSSDIKKQLYDDLYNENNIKQLREIAKSLKINKTTTLKKSDLTWEIVERKMQDIKKTELEKHFEEQQYENIDEDISMLTKRVFYLKL